MRVSTIVKIVAGVLAATYALAQIANAVIRRREDVDPDSIERPGGMFYLRGVGMHFIERGAGPPLLLLHGFGGSTYNFRHQLGPLSRHYRVLALDLPGFGLAERPIDADLSFTAQAERVLEFMDRLDIERATILGYSMGGTIAMRLAAAHPERVERLIVVCGPSPDRALRFPLIRYTRPLLSVPYAFWWGRPGYVRRTLRQIVYDPSWVTDEILAEYAYPARMRGSASSLFKLGQDVGTDAPVDPASITTRTLLLWGEADTAVPLSTAHRLHATMPDARLEVIPRAGHLVLEEQPEMCNERILHFLTPTTTGAMATAR